MKAGLVKQDIGKYTLTPLGKVVYDTLMIIESALENFWKLKAIDSLEAADAAVNDTLSEDERTKLLDSLIDDEKIKKIILAKYANPRYIKAEVPLH
jgi:hypothetical protein